MTINLKYIETVCNSYNNLDDQRFCWALHALAETINNNANGIGVIIFLIIVSFVLLFLQNRKIKKLLQNTLKKD